MKMQVSLFKKFVFIFTISLLTLGALGNLSYGDTTRSQIYWTDLETQKIQRANLDGTNIQDIVISGFAIPLGVALDTAAGKMYWADWFLIGAIRCSDLDGTNVRDIITVGLQNPWSIALDVASGKIYWADIETGKIQRANLDGTDVQDLVTGLERPWDIELDLIRRKIYWVDQHIDTIQRANLDGTDVQDILTEELEDTGWIALDAVGEKIYWADDSKIWRATLDGSNVEAIISEGLDNPRDIALDVDGGKIYWTHAEFSVALGAYTNGKVQRANLDGSNVEDIVTGLERPAGIAIGFDIPYQSTPPDSGETFETARLLTLDTSHTETIASVEDVDYFRIEVEQTGELTVWTTGTFDTVGELRNSSGEIVAEDDDAGYGFNFSIVYTVMSPGTYYVKVEGHWLSAETGTYTVHTALEPLQLDRTAPEVVSSDPQNWAEDVDPDTVSKEGIVVVFSEDVTGELLLLDGDEDVGWVSFAEGDTITLTSVAGAELENETEYTVIGEISDAAGNETDVHITFVTNAEWFLPTDSHGTGVAAVDGLVAYWAFNEAGGELAKDTSGNGHDGTLIGAPKRTKGYFGGALAFDGVDDKVVVPYHPALNQETFSICFWVNVAPGSTWYRAPVSCRDLESVTSGYNFYVNPDNAWDFWIGTDDGWRRVGADSGIGEWEHITGVYADGWMKLYVNGELSSEGYLPTLRLNVNTRQELLIGAGANEAATHNYYFKGMIDEVRVYNRALSAAEIVLVMETEVAELPVGPKIEGPWLWMLVPTYKSGSEAAVGTDYLAEASGGIVTETAIATKGARSGAFVGNRRWTPGRLAPTGRNNINELVNEIGLATGNVDYHVAYGSIVLDVPHEQETLMYAGSDDAVKVWLNGDLVHNNPVDRGAISYQESFPITLKEGENVLLVAVYDGIVDWAGFFGFAKDTVYTVLPPVMSAAADVGDTLETATSLALDTSHTDAIFPGDDVDYFRIEVEQPGELTIYTTSDLDTVGELLTDDGEVLATGDDEGEFLNFQIVHSVRPGTYYANVGSYESASGSYTIYAAFTPALSADVNGDGVVNIQDLVLVAGAFGETGENVADVNGDGEVNIQDLVLVAGAFGDAAAAPAAHNLSSLTPETVQQWLTESKLIDEKSAVYQRGILVLEQLLAALIPQKTALLANYPNPFNPETWIPYQLAAPADVTLTIYAANGAIVRTLALGHQPVGMYQSRSRAAYWDGKNAVGEPVASGVYFYTLTAGDFSATRKMLIRK